MLCLLGVFLGSDNHQEASGAKRREIMHHLAFSALSFHGIAASCALAEQG